MQGIPSYYRADDLLLNALYDEGSRICGNRPYTKAPDFPADSFDKSSKKDLVKKGLTIGGILTAVGVAAACVWKFLRKKP